MFESISYESIVRSDPTFRFFLRETKIDGGKNFDWQVHIKCQVAKLVLGNYIDKMYKKAIRDYGNTTN